MDWLLLVLAGCFEVAFTTCLKLSDGFTRIVPSILFLLFSVVSFGLLTLAARSIPMGTAYAVWTGIGAFGTAMIGIVFFGDPTTFARLFFLSTLITSVIGLKLASPEESKVESQPLNVVADE